MPRGKYLTDIEKGKILAFLENNLSYREIGRKIGRSDKVIRNFMKNQSGYGKQKTGGPKFKLLERDKRHIINTSSNSMKSLSQLANECSVKVSKNTIRRVLQGSKTIVRQKLMTVPKLLPRHKVGRLEFAKKNMQTNWKKVICKIDDFHDFKFFLFFFVIFILSLF